MDELGLGRRLYIETVFFFSPLVKPPIQQEQAKQDLLPFVSSVVCALKELHDFGIAHLDSRLETSNSRLSLLKNIKSLYPTS